MLLKEVEVVDFKSNTEYIFKVKPYSKDIKNKIIENELSEMYIAGQIQAFGIYNLKEYQKKNNSFQIIDKNKMISIIFQFEEDKLKIVDIIKNNNIYLSEGLKFNNV